MTDGPMTKEVAVSVFGLLVAFFTKNRFTWQAAHGLIHRTLTDAELRECIDDVYERWRMLLAKRGVIMSTADHIYFKDALIKKMMGPTKQTWTK